MGGLLKYLQCLFTLCKWHRTEHCWWEMQVLPREEWEKTTAQSLELLGTTEMGARNAEHSSDRVTSGLKGQSTLNQGAANMGIPLLSSA